MPSGGVRRLAHDRPGQAPESIAENEGAPSVVGVSAQYVYWFNAGDGRVRGAAKASKRVFTVASDQRARAITADERGVYWTSDADRKVFAAFGQ